VQLGPMRIPTSGQASLTRGCRPTKNEVDSMSALGIASPMRWKDIQRSDRRGRTFVVFQLIQDRFLVRFWHGPPVRDTARVGHFHLDQCYIRSDPSGRVDQVPRGVLLRIGVGRHRIHWQNDFEAQQRGGGGRVQNRAVRGCPRGTITAVIPLSLRSFSKSVRWNLLAPEVTIGSFSSGGISRSALVAWPNRLSARQPACLLGEPFALRSCYPVGCNRAGVRRSAVHTVSQ
jgi:hypothetical protein